MRSLIADFDDRVSFGSREHYFHFLLGYLLPGLSVATRHGRLKETCFVSCGPVMDSLIHEACSRLKLPYRIVTRQERLDMAPDSYRFRYADRWDHHFADLGRTNLARLRKVRIRARIVRQLLQVRNRLHDACQETGENRTRNHEFERVSTEDLVVARPWLLLRRSAQPEFYDDGGSAEISGYGQRRRSIKNLQSLAEAITAAGFKVAIYEPGVHSLGHQIQTFGMAKGIIGIRGAEFANLSWMRSDSHAVMIATPAKVGVTSRNLARALGIGFHSIPVAETYPDVNPEDVLAILRRIDHPS